VAAADLTPPRNPRSASCQIYRTISKNASPATARSRFSVIGRKSGTTISVPVWFVLEGEKLYLLPVRGSNTQWYKNVLKNPQIRIDARDTEARVTAKPITESAAVKSVIEKFREKYGAKDVKKYYSKFDVAVVVQLT
jgi:deazaflavin-dependent oxidoreductase (nitroreductase family)